MVVHHSGEDVGEVGLRLDAVQLAGLHQAGQHRPVLAAGVGAGEQSVLAVQGNRWVILPISGKT